MKRYQSLLTACLVYALLFKTCIYFYHFVLDQIPTSASYLEIDHLSYFEGSSFLLSASREGPICAVILLSVLIALGGLYFIRKWSDSLKIYKVLLFTLLSIFSWYLALYQYNWIAGQLHLWDRIIIVLCAALAYFYPTFILPLLVFGAISQAQFYISPDLQHTDVNVRIVFALLVMYLSLAVVEFLSRKKFRYALEFFLIVTMTHYLYPGCIKIFSAFSEVSWIREADVPLLIRSADFTGMGSSLVQQFILSTTNTFTSKMLSWSVVVLQLSCLLYCGKKSRAFVILVSYLIFHLAIFLLSGILFSSWMVIVLVLLFQIYAQPKSELPGIRWWTVPVLTVFLALIIAPHKLFWFGSEHLLVNQFRTSDGAIISPNAFAPFDHAFAISNFSELCMQSPELLANRLGFIRRNQKRMVDRIGTTDIFKEVQQESLLTEKWDQFSNLLKKRMVADHQMFSFSAASLPHFWYRNGIVRLNESKLDTIKIIYVGAKASNEEINQIYQKSFYLSDF